jgi:hypothetical protein
VLPILTGLLPSSWGAHINAYLPEQAGTLITHTRQTADDLLSPLAGLRGSVHLDRARPGRRRLPTRAPRRLRACLRTSLTGWEVSDVPGQGAACRGVNEGGSW